MQNNDDPRGLKELAMPNPSPGTIGLFANIRQSLKKPRKSAIYCIGLTADVCHCSPAIG